jgi:hypothetical protein
MLECPQWVESCRLRQSVTFPAWQPAKLTRTAGFGQKRPLEVQCLNQKMYSHHFSILMCPAVSENEVNQSATEEDCPFVSLVLRLLDYDGEDLFSNVLMPWVEARPGAVAWLASLRGRGCNAVPTVQPEDLCRLYALNRVCEMLMLSLETAEPQARTGGHLALSMWQFEDFFSRLGIDAMRPKIFAPFHHEIVATFPAPAPGQVPQILAWHWPCLMLGTLMIQRGGVTLSAGEEVLAPCIADTSTLYWAYHRNSRPTHDLAHGWGSNSRWRTAFRRDYHLGDNYHFNVDGKCDLSFVVPGMLDESGLSRAERIELLINRSFVTIPKEHTDLFPYGDRLSLMASAPPSQSPPSLWRRLLG